MWNRAFNPYFSISGAQNGISSLSCSLSHTLSLLREVVIEQGESKQMTSAQSSAVRQVDANLQEKKAAGATNVRSIQLTGLCMCADYTSKMSHILVTLKPNSN